MVARMTGTRAKSPPPRGRHKAATTREWRMCAATCAKRITDSSLTFEWLLVKDITSSQISPFSGHRL
jgi:hypothetical protein